MEHFNNPHNAGVIEDADGVGEVAIQNYQENRAQQSMKVPQN